MCTTLNINTTFFKRQTDLLSLTQFLVSHTYKAWRYARPFSLQEFKLYTHTLKKSDIINVTD